MTSRRRIPVGRSLDTVRGEIAELRKRIAQASGAYRVEFFFAQDDGSFMCDGRTHLIDALPPVDPARVALFDGPCRVIFQFVGPAIDPSEITESEDGSCVIETPH